MHKPQSPAERHIVEKFVDATVKVPQVPYGGIIEVGGAFVDLMDRGEMDVAGLAGMRMTGHNLRQAVAGTVPVHENFGVSNVGLTASMPFAFELVQSGLIRAVSVLATADGAAEVGPIPPVNLEDTARAEAFLASAGNRSVVRGLFAAVSKRLDQPDVADTLAPYRLRMAAVSQAFAHADRGDRAAMRQKSEQLHAARDVIMGVVAPAVAKTLLPFAAERPGVVPFGDAIVSAAPTP